MVLFWESLAARLNVLKEEVNTQPSSSPSSATGAATQDSDEGIEI